MSDFRNDSAVSIVPKASITVVVLMFIDAHSMEDTMVYVFPGTQDRATVLQAIATDMSEDEESEDENSVVTPDEIEDQYDIDIRHQSLDVLPGRDWRSDMLEDR